MTDVPHFSLPFRFSGGPSASPTVGAATSEQDSIDEIADCVYAVMVCPLGFRVELPNFGTPQQVFASPAPDLGMMRQAVELWEPRAALSLTQLAAGDLPEDVLVARIEAAVAVRTEE